MHLTKHFQTDKTKKTDLWYWTERPSIKTWILIQICTNVFKKKQKVEEIVNQSQLSM